MKVLFLDIDGVFNSRPFFEKTYNASDTTSLEREIDLSKVVMLCKFVVENDITVCLSSSWRIGWGSGNLDKQLDSIFRGNGVVISEFTPNNPYPPEWNGLSGDELHIKQNEYADNNLPWGRSYEIKQWLEQHSNVTEWCAVDDDLYDMGWVAKQGKLIQTSFYGEGLTHSHIAHIAEVLKCHEAGKKYVAADGQMQNPTRNPSA